jgi:P27 family predicted phage terminase small subunit
MHIAEGTYRADKHGDRDFEPLVELEIPPCPDDLQGAARTEWERITPLLKDMGVLALVDMSSVTGYCVSWARWREAEAQITEQGMIVRGPNGSPIQNPFLSVANQAMANLRAYGSELGLSPVARTRIKAQPKKKDAGGVMKRNRA